MVTTTPLSAIGFSRMFIKIDEDNAGYAQGIFHEAVNPAHFDHPDGSGKKTDIVGVLTHHNANPQSREVGGWHVLNQLSGESHPMTRWDRMVEAVGKLPQDHPLQKLGLRKGA